MKERCGGLGKGDGEIAAEDAGGHRATRGDAAPALEGFDVVGGKEANLPA